MSVTLTTPLSGTAVLTSGTAPSVGKLNIYNATSGAITATLPALSGLNVGARLAVQKYQGDTSANTVTISCAGSDTFTYSGNTSVTLTVTGEQREIQVVSISGTKYWQHVGSWVPLAALDSRYPGAVATSTTMTGGTTTLDATSAPVQIFNGTSDQTVKLPSMGIPLGKTIRVHCFSGGNAVNVQTASGSAVTSVFAGCSRDFMAAVANPSSPSDWKVFSAFGNSYLYGANLSAAVANFATIGWSTISNSTLNSPVVTVTVNAQTGTAYTPVIGDASQLVTLNNSSAITLTVPTNTSVAYPVGTHIDIAQLGAGQVTVVGDTGVTVNGTPGLKLSAQYAGARLTKLATNTWVITGTLAA